MQLQFRTHDNDGAARVVHALAEQVLTEPSLLAFERIGKRLERAVVRATQHTAAAAVIEQRIDGFLEHALFVADNHIRSVQLDQLLQAVVAVDDAAIQIVQIGGGEAAAIQRDQGTQLRRNDRQHVQNHPLRLVSGFAEALGHAQALGVLYFLLLRSLGLHPLADVFAQSFAIDFLEQFLDSFGAHHGDEFSRELLIELALALVADDFGTLQFGNLAGVDNDEGFEIENALQFAQRDVEQVADAARQTFEEPDVGAGAGEFDVPQSLAADAGERDFDAALIADYAAMLHALVLTAETLPVGYRTENARAEQPVALGVEGAVVESLRLGDLTMRPATDLFRRGERNADGIKIRDQVRAVIRG